MSRKVLFNDGWKFHLGELPQLVEKITPKTGTCGGASQLTTEEGFRYQLPPMLAEFYPPEEGNAFYNVSDKLEGEWKEVAIPHDWKIRQPYSEPKEGNTVLTGRIVTEATTGYLPDNIGYYRKKFRVPSESLGKRIFLEFEGVMRDSTVWVNGCYIGSHVSGYTGFAYDISEYVNYGKEGENVVLVKTDSTYKEGWWAEGAGIYRNIWINTLETIHVKRHGIFVYTKEINKNQASIAVETEIENLRCKAEKIEISHTILDQNHKAVAVTVKTATIEARCEDINKVIITVDSPELWSPDAPNLYVLHTEIKQDENVLDTVDTTFGIREITYTENGLYVNGKPYEIKGSCVHQDFAGVGIGLTEDIIDYRLERILDMGGNAYRSAHHPATEYLLDACDRKGILVMNENRRLEMNQEGILDLEELIKGSRNHPSIFMWSLENEEFITVLPAGKRLLRALVKKAKELDPTRHVTVAGQFAKADLEYMQIPDVAGFNYDCGEAKLIREHIPGKLTIASEDSSFVSTRNVYKDNRKLGIVDSYDSGGYYAKLANDTDDTNDRGISSGTIGGAVAPGSLAYAWTHYKEEAPWLGGIFIWTAFDYRGETFPWNWPTVISHYGAMDYCGFEKDIFYYWKSVWTDTPMIHVLPHWNWDGREGEKIQLDVYSNCDEVELFVNEVSQGRQKHRRGYITSWKAEYVPGKVEVIGYKDGREAARDSRETAGRSEKIRMTEIYRGRDTSFIKCEIVDKRGILCPCADDHIQFSVENGEVIGVGNGNPASHESDVLSERDAFNGLALLIVKRQDKKVEIKAEVANLGEVKIYL
ncbi:beta-galactosidase [Lachnospiraceae bacterium KM106-2]|nr:beta-galactosidase [Lachnospiraceae bacterium KM106-2]